MRKNSGVVGVPVEELAHLADEEATVEREYLREERKIILHRALRKLKSEYREEKWPSGLTASVRNMSLW